MSSRHGVTFPLSRARSDDAKDRKICDHQADKSAGNLIWQHPTYERFDTLHGSQTSLSTMATKTTDGILDDFMARWIRIFGSECVDFARLMTGMLLPIEAMLKRCREFLDAGPV